ncbi:MAG: hypothetical protein K9K78_00830 [Spirochaetales bacterium]|nr:hypothetical protein [Spirochaetales bacterium]
MADTVKPEPCRKAFTRKLTELAARDRNIMVVCSDARGSVTLTDFAEKLPEQFVETGIAEQNEVGIAAGLANFGKQAFVCAPACFISTRSLEQIKIDVVYSASNVKIVGVSGGVSYGALGFSHHSLHDLAVMNTFPGMAVLLPADRLQAEAMTEWMASYKGPVYMRMGRGAVPDVYENSRDSFIFGQANTLREGDDVCIIAAGEMLSKAAAASDMLRREKINVKVLDMHTIKPIDADAIRNAARETGAVLSIEEHSQFGGLGSAVSDIIIQDTPVPMKILAIPDEIPVEGESADICSHYGLTPDGIVEEVRALLKKKAGFRAES